MLLAGQIKNQNEVAKQRNERKANEKGWEILNL